MMSTTTKDRSSSIDVAKNNFFQPLEAIDSINEGAKDLLIASSSQNRVAPLQRRYSKQPASPSVFSFLMSKVDSTTEKSDPAPSPSAFLVHNSSLHSVGLKQSHHHDVQCDYLSKDASSNWQSKNPLGSILNFAKSVQLPSRSAEAPIVGPTSEQLQEDQQDPLDRLVPDSRTTKRKRILSHVDPARVFEPLAVRLNRIIASKANINSKCSPNQLAFEFDHEIELPSDQGSLSSGYDEIIEPFLVKQKNGENIIDGILTLPLLTTSKHVGARTKGLPTKFLIESQPDSNSGSLASLLDEFEGNSKPFTRQRGDSVLDLLFAEESDSFSMFEKATEEGQDAPSAKEAGQRLFKLIGDLLPLEGATTGDMDNIVVQNTRTQEAGAPSIIADYEVEVTSAQQELESKLVNSSWKSEIFLEAANDQGKFKSDNFPDSGEASYQVDAQDGMSLDTTSPNDDHFFYFEVENDPNRPALNTCTKFKQSMAKTTTTQTALQEWDRANGLPKSHCQTMVNSSRSREQLLSGLILQKWNGVPLLNLPGAKIKVTRRMFRGSKLTGLVCEKSCEKSRSSNAFHQEL